MIETIKHIFGHQENISYPQQTIIIPNFFMQRYAMQNVDFR